MSGSQVVATVVTGLVALLGGAVLVLLFTGAEPDYADLIPAPDEIPWKEGDETEVWLDSNVHDVDMRVGSVSLGLGGIHRLFPDSGESMTLGHGQGCLAWAVNMLEVGAITGAGSQKSVQIDGTIDRGTEDGGVVVHYRSFPDGRLSLALVGEVAVPPGDTDFSFSYSIQENGISVFEAGDDERFPEPTTRRIRVNVSDVGTATVDAESEEIKFPRDGGIGLIACAEDDDVAVSLHDSEGEQLNSYLVDIYPDDPRPTVVPPQTTEPYVAIRVCVDAANNRANYLDGGELAGAPLDATDFGLTGSILDAFLTEATPGSAYLYYFGSQVTAGDVQLSITDAGAGDTLGLDADRVYPVQVTATTDNGTPYDANYAGIDIDGNPVQDADDEALVGPATSDDETMTIAVGVWLDTANLSPNDDGRCS